MSLNTDANPMANNIRPPTPRLQSPNPNASNPMQMLGSDSNAQTNLTTAILASVQTFMDGKTSALERKIERALTKNIDESVEQATKKIRRDNPELMNNGNKDQYAHNITILDTIDAATSHLRNAEIKEAMDQLTAGKEIILERQRLIRLADREEGGWLFVKEYKQDDNWKYY